MKLSCLFGIGIISLLGAAPAAAQSLPPATAEEAGAAQLQFEVERRSTIPLPAEGRKLILQRVKPPVLPPQRVDPILSPALRAARIDAAQARRMFFLTASYYPNGFTYLKWTFLLPGGQLEACEAWSRTDFRQLWLVDDFAAGGVRYHFFLLGSPPSRRELARPFPGLMEFGPDSSGFKIVKGDPSHREALRPVEVLHRICREEGPGLTARLQQHRQEQADGAARLKANPPSPSDSVVSFWPIKSNRHPVLPLLPAGLPPAAGVPEVVR